MKTDIKNFLTVVSLSLVAWAIPIDAAQRFLAGDISPELAGSYLAALGARGSAGCSAEQLTVYRLTFKRLDGDGDGNLSSKEYVEDGTYLAQQARSGIFSASDSNRDGTVSHIEYVDNRIITDEAKAIMQRADFDRDRTITKAEFLKHPALPDRTIAAEIFGHFDRDGDGEITMLNYLRVWGKWARESGLIAVTTAGVPEFTEDTPASRPTGELGGPSASRFRSGGPPNPEQIFQRFDGNKDEKLTEEELPELLWSRLSALDSDKDGAVTRKEMELGRKSEGKRP